MIKPNWDIFKAKFSDNPQYNFEWFCYLLFCKEYNQKFGIFRYKNQASIETDPIMINGHTIGWQAKFYEVALSTKKNEILSTIEKAKKYYPSISKLIFYTNQEWGQNEGETPKGLIEIESRAEELNIILVWRVASFFESEFVCIENEIIANHFFLQDCFLPTMDDLLQKNQVNIKNVGKRYAPNIDKYIQLNQKNIRLEKYFNAYDIDYIIKIIQNLFTEKYSYRPSLNTLNNITAIPDYQSSYEGHFSYFGNDEDFDIKEKDLLDLSLLFEEFKNDIIKQVESLYVNDIDFFITYIKKFYNYLNIFLKQIDLGRQLLYKKYPREVSDTFYVELEIIDSYYNLVENAIKTIKSEEFQIFEKKSMLIIGEALIGKTHLFCDVALNRLQNNNPTILVFANLFDKNKTIIDNIISQIGLINISEYEFLQGLNLLSTRYSSKTLIMIDAINEKNAPEIFKESIIKFNEQIKNYPNLAIAMSIRDVELNRISTSSNEEYLDNEIIHIQHKGFEGIELEAVTTFCNALNVELPKIPFHITHLFINPGILFMYIELIKDSKEKMDISIINPTKVFQSYLNDLERKFFQLYSNDIDEEDRVVKEAVNTIISLGTNEDLISFYFDYQNVKKNLTTIHKKVLEFLISEGVLNKFKTDESTRVYFTYQKFENFFIADYLLTKYEDNKEKILNLLKEHYGAMSEALLMQIPEKLNKEIFELNRWLLRDKYICELYIKSLVWRKPETINDNTFKYIKFILGYENIFEEYLNTILQLSTIPNHPLNFKNLHEKLKKFNISERDYNWSIYIHNSFYYDGIVKRLINWAWNKKDNFELEDESLYLYGLTLSWFLTSSNRDLRDSTTKSLVNIFTNKINIFLDVLKSFEGVDDLYVLERLYAVSYGIVLRSNNQNGFKELGEYIYHTLFNVDFVIEHILLREYASNTIEYINKLNHLNINLSKIYPPYNQNHSWTLPEISKADVEKYRNDYKDIYSSSLHGDFKIYQVYSEINHFLNLKISDRPHQKLSKERYEDFMNSLNSEQKKEYDKIRFSSNKIMKILNNITQDELDEEIKSLDIEQDVLDKLQEERLKQSSFKELLLPEQLKEYDDFIVSYTKEDEYKFTIDIKSIKRLIFLEAIQLGWDKEFFEEFDNRVGHRGRMEHQTERIGKKYQWIAFYKVLARLTDNYEYQNGRHENKISEYQGTYQSYIRNIDPTTILKEKRKDENKWWFNINNDFENKSISNKEWMSSVEKLPSISSLVQLKNDDNEYLLHSMNFSIDGTEDTNKKYRNLYYDINAFILNKSNLKEFITWLKSVNYYGQHKMPQSNHIQKTFLREYPNSKSYEYFDNYYYGQMDWEDDFEIGDNEIPCKVLLTSTSYFNEGRSYDKSVNETIEIGLPNKWFVKDMNLKQTINDGEWIDKNNNVVFFDPTIDSGCITEFNENGVLVSDKKLLLEYLEQNNYTIVWIMWGEKQVRNNRDSHNGDFLGIGEIRGYGYIDDDSNFVEEIIIDYNK
jgi:hypothetical protein